MRTSLTVCLSSIVVACQAPSPAPDASAPDVGTDSAPSIDAATAPDSGPMCGDYAGCTTASAIDDTSMATISIGAAGSGATGDNFRYATPCVRIHAGATVTIVNSTLHPLRAASCSPSDTPITGGTQTTFTFAHAGRYGYWCENHGSDDGMPPGMAGLIIVE